MFVLSEVKCEASSSPGQVYVRVRCVKCIHSTCRSVPCVECIQLVVTRLRNRRAWYAPLGLVARFVCPLLPPAVVLALSSYVEARWEADVCSAVDSAVDG